MLSDGLLRRGHEVTLIAAPGSHIEGARVVSPLGTLPPVIGTTLDEWRHVARAQSHLEECDVVVDHSGPLGALLTAGGTAPAVHVVHGPVDELAAIYRSVADQNARLQLVAISGSQVALAPDLPFVGVCRNAVDIDAIPFHPTADNQPYLAFLGRISPDKGVAAAIRVARAAGIKLLIAAKCREPAERAHFAEVVEPELGDDVVYLGEIGAREKYDLLGRARALLFPIDWEEPFGLVMIEAMACGTPVIATRRGAAPEVVADGVTGYVCDDEDALVEAVDRLSLINRSDCRTRVRQNFSVDVMASAYERILARAAHERPAGGRSDRMLISRGAGPAVSLDAPARTGQTP
jgi:glycosyltransferase involved in cell wall biosynthesis